MPKTPAFPIRVFYDGACSVCATEIEHYLHQDHGGRLQAVDISAPEFDPQQYNIPLGDFMYELHVMDQKGQIYRGVDAFWAIWQVFPTSPFYGVMGTIITLPVVNPVARLVYQGFARLRPYLPKRKNCQGGTCGIGRH